MRTIPTSTRHDGYPELTPKEREDLEMMHREDDRRAQQDERRIARRESIDAAMSRAPDLFGYQTWDAIVQLRSDLAHDRLLKRDAIAGLFYGVSKEDLILFLVEKGMLGR